MTIFEYAIARHVAVLLRKSELTESEEHFLNQVDPLLRALEERERMRDALPATRRR
jgi:hypothetical protein